MKRKAVAPTRVGRREDILKIDPPLFAFDYTADQWTKIQATLATRATPGFYDLEKVCGDLRAIACCYRWRAACHEGATKWAEHLDRQWLTVADAAETIMENMEITGGLRRRGTTELHVGSRRTPCSELPGSISAAILT
jgi:hypothetical protein